MSCLRGQYDVGGNNHEEKSFTISWCHLDIASTHCTTNLTNTFNILNIKPIKHAPLWQIRHLPLTRGSLIQTFGIWFDPHPEFIDTHSSLVQFFNLVSSNVSSSQSDTITVISAFLNTALEASIFEPLHAVGGDPDSPSTYWPSATLFWTSFCIEVGNIKWVSAPKARLFHHLWIQSINPWGPAISENKISHAIHMEIYTMFRVIIVQCLPLSPQTYFSLCLRSTYFSIVAQNTASLTPLWPAVVWGGVLFPGKWEQLNLTVWL